MAQKSTRDDKSRQKRLRKEEIPDRLSKRLKSNDATLEAINHAMGHHGEPSTAIELAADKSSQASKSQYKYGQQLAIYQNEGMSQLSMLVIRRLISEATIPAPRNKEALMKMLSDTAKELILNELELVVWAIYLEKFVWKDMSQPLETLLQYSAFAVKTYMNEEVAIFQTHLNSRFVNFTSRYNDWISKHRSRMGVAPRELNIKFRRLTKPLTSQDDVKIIDYNFYVDEILQISPPYSSVQDREAIEIKRQEAMKDPLDIESQYFNDDRVQPEFQKQDSIDDFEGPDLMNQLSVGSFSMMNPPFDRYDSYFSPYLTNMTRQNSTSTHSMQLRKTNSKGELTLPEMKKQSSFVTSLINSDF